MIYGYHNAHNTFFTTVKSGCIKCKSRVANIKINQKLNNCSLKATHPVNVHIAFWNDMGVEECGFTSWEERVKGTRSDWCWWKGRTEKVTHCPFSLTCRETHGNNDFCLAGGERGRRWVVQSCSGVNLPLEVHIKKILTKTQTQTKPTNVSHTL